MKGKHCAWNSKQCSSDNITVSWGLMRRAEVGKHCAWNWKQCSSDHINVNLVEGVKRRAEGREALCMEQ